VLEAASRVVSAGGVDAHPAVKDDSMRTNRIDRRI
jgi:hypothetical protein